MDRRYIENEHVVDRYLSGDLTVREARDFEKFCQDNPAFLQALPIPVRLKTRLSRRPVEDSARDRLGRQCRVRGDDVQRSRASEGLDRGGVAAK